jgi:energy-coupling factor transporter ATP-binding protein EcfA2
MNSTDNNIIFGVQPPLQTNIQTLPFENLEWDKFEQLCMTLIQWELNFSINDCERYGIKGENQQGIDIFARHESGFYSTFQCKKYESFTKKDIAKAIERFQKGDFFNKSHYFYICTACELNSVHIQDDFEQHKLDLKSNNIDLIKWDKIQLSRILKDHPQIVYDFFGKEYVKAFNGEDALSTIFHFPEEKIKSYLDIESSELYNVNNNFHIPDSHIERKETKRLYEWIQKALEGEEDNIAVLTGGAGCGKTVILKDLLNLLNESSIPVLGLKSDKKYLNLENINKSIFDGEVNILEAFRQLSLKHKTVVILVDQIDALSQSLSTNRTQIKAYLSLINQLSRLDRIRIIISCRKFDLNYDADLRQFTHKTIFEVSNLTDPEIEPVLRKLTGNELSYFPKELIELLRTPLHLEVFCRIYNNSKITNEIKSLQDLYRNLWNQKVKEVKGKTDIDPLRLESVIFDIANQIYERQDNLSVPVELLDQYYDEVKYLRTEGLITGEKGSIQFFHQTFYDYCYARDFVERQGGHLYNYLVALAHQGLFIRSSIRQVLSYLRTYNPKQYISELRKLLFSEGIRYHIKRLVVDHLSFESNPTFKELEIIIELTGKNKILASSFFYNIPNDNWYRLFIKEQTTIVKLINRVGEQLQEDVARFVVFYVNNDIEATYGLLQKVIDDGERYSLIDWTLIRTQDFTKSIVLKSYQDIDIHYISSGRQRFQILDTAISSNPNFAIEEVKKICSNNEWKFLIDRNTNDEEHIHNFENFCEKLYKAYPQKAYLFFKDIVRELIKLTITESYLVLLLEEDTVFKNYDPNECTQHKLIKWIIEYLQKETISNPEFVKVEIDSYLSGNKATEIHIALQVMSENISVFTTEIFTLLLKKELIDDFLEIEDIEYWYRLLLEKVSLFLDDAKKNILNQIILSHFTDKDHIKNKSFKDERERYGLNENAKFYPYPFWGYNQRKLLHALPIEYINNYSVLKRRKQELDRKFSGPGWECNNIKPFYGATMATFCGPILSDDKYKLLSKKQWLKSFLVYDKDIHYSKQPYLDIDAHARAFKEVVKNNVEEYYEFVAELIISNSVNIRYLINGLEGLIEGGYDISATRNLYSYLMKYKIGDHHIYSFIRLSKVFIKARKVDEELIDFIKGYIVLPLQGTKSISYINQENEQNDILFSEGWRSINTSAIDSLIELSLVDEYKNDIFDFFLKISSALPIQLRLVVLYELQKGTGFSIEKLLELFHAYTIEVSSEIYFVAQQLLNRLFYNCFDELIPFVRQTMGMKEAAKSLGILLFYGWLYHHDESKQLLLELHQIQPESIKSTMGKAFEYLSNPEFEEKCMYIINLYAHDKRKFIREEYLHNFHRLSPDNFLTVKSIIQELINEQDEEDRLYNLYRYLIRCCNFYYSECIDILTSINFDNNCHNKKEFEEPVKILTISYNALKEFDSSNPQMEFAMDVFDKLLQQLNYRTNIEEILRTMDFS